MANSTVEGLADEATSLDGTELSYVDQGGVDKKVTKATEKAYYNTGQVPATRTITTDKSLTGGGTLAANRTIELDGDQESPGNNKYYGTNALGAKGFHSLASSSSIDNEEVDTTADPIVFDMNSQASRQFIASDTIVDPLEWTFINTSAAVYKIFLFQIVAGVDQEFPAGSKFIGPVSFLNEIVGVVWTPTVPGYYKATGNFDGTNWWWTMEGPAL
jgi:hypothetical protein